MEREPLVEFVLRDVAVAGCVGEQGRVHVVADDDDRPSRFVVICFLRLFIRYRRYIALSIRVCGCFRMRYRVVVVTLRFGLFLAWIGRCNGCNAFWGVEGR